MIRFLLLFAILIGASQSAQAQTAKSQTSTNQLLGLVFSKRPFDAATRTELTSLFAAYCRDVLTAVPSNTPAEEAWVEDESRTSDMAKLVRLGQTMEFARSMVRRTFSECVDTTARLATVQARFDRNREAALFVSLAVTFNESADTERFADRIGVNRNDFQFGILGSLRRILMIAALRTLDGT